MESAGRKIDIVIPCYNEEQNIFSLVEAIDRHFAGVSYDYRYLFVDDGSRDRTCARVRELAARREDVCLIKLSRNFGKEAAMAAGLRHSSADAAIILDSDLQHPPDLIPAMIAEWERGALIVDAVKVARSKENVFRRSSSRLFNKVFTQLTSIDFADSSDFKLLDRRAIDILNGIQEKTRFFRGLTHWIGLPHARVEFQVAERHAGQTKWNLLSLLRLSVDAVTSYSQKPLQIITLLGLFTLVFSVALGAQTLYNKLADIAVDGFTTVILLILLLSSFIMIGIGILGIYLSKIYEEIKGRPICIIEEFTGLAKPESSSRKIVELNSKRAIDEH